MIKKTVLLTAIIAVSINLTGQTSSDPKSIMDRVSKKLKSYTSIQADFSFSLFNPEEKINDSQEGSLLLSGEKYRLKMSGITAISDGKTLWTVNEELKEANILDPGDNDLFNPKSIFTLYEKNFEYQSVTSSGDKAVIDLIPLQKDENYSRIRMEISKSKDQIDQVTYYSNDGNLYIIKIKKLVTNIPVQDSRFTFDVKDYPDVKLFDMR